MYGQQGLIRFKHNIQDVQADPRVRDTLVIRNGDLWCVVAYSSMGCGSKHRVEDRDACFATEDQARVYARQLLNPEALKQLCNERATHKRNYDWELNEDYGFMDLHYDYDSEMYACNFIAYITDVNGVLRENLSPENEAKVRRMEVEIEAVKRAFWRDAWF